MTAPGDDQRTGRPPGARGEGKEKPYEQDPLYQYLTRERRRNYRLSRRDALNASQRLRRANDPDRRDKERARRYGLALEELRAMRTRQGHACAICRRSDRPLSVDHCHRTGMVRRLLCRNCNTGLGCFDDDPRLLRAAAAYLEAARRAQRRALRRGAAQRWGAIGAWPESLANAACRAVWARMQASSLSGVSSAGTVITSVATRCLKVPVRMASLRCLLRKAMIGFGVLAGAARPTKPR
jgi:hypothetical protein